MATLEIISDKTIFIVEDELLIAAYVTDLLEDLGCRSVIAANNIADATAELKICKPHLALLDLKLGGVFSYSIAELLAGDNVPIIFTTGFEVETLDPAWAPYPVLTKPYSVEALSAALMRALA